MSKKKNSEKSNSKPKKKKGTVAKPEDIKVL